MAVGLKRVVPPASEPVSLTALKSHLNIEATFTDDDDLLAGMISSAREDAEDFTGRSLVLQQWIYALDYFPIYRLNDFAPFDAQSGNSLTGYRWNHSQIISIPQPPLLSVDQLVFVDVTGAQNTWTAPQYQVDNVSEPGRLAPLVGTVWPVTAPGVLNAVQIHFTSGYATVPYRFMQAIKLRAAAYYANREEFIAGVTMQAPEWFERMLTLDRKNIFGLVNAG